MLYNHLFPKVVNKQDLVYLVDAKLTAPPFDSFSPSLTYFSLNGAALIWSAPASITFLSALAQSLRKIARWSFNFKSLAAKIAIFGGFSHRFPFKKRCKSDEKITIDYYTSTILLLKKDGCPVCRQMEEHNKRYLFWLLNQNYYEPFNLNALIKSGGHCEKHGRELVEIGAKYVTGAMYHFLVKNALSKITWLLEKLDDDAASKNKDSQKKKFLKAARKAFALRGQCPWCQSLADSAARDVKELVDGMAFPEIKELYRGSSGLCMKHFRLALNLAMPDAAAELCAKQLSSLGLLNEEFNEYFRKVDYRFSHEPKGSEQTAWLRAIDFFAGGKQGQ